MPSQCFKQRNFSATTTATAILEKFVETHLSLQAGYDIVRATENLQLSPAPRYTFSRGDELSCDNQIHPGNEHL